MRTLKITELEILLDRVEFNIRRLFELKIDNKYEVFFPNIKYGKRLSENMIINLLKSGYKNSNGIAVSLIENNSHFKFRSSKFILYKSIPIPNYSIKNTIVCNGNFEVSVNLDEDKIKNSIIDLFQNIIDFIKDGGNGFEMEDDSVEIFSEILNYIKDGE